MSPSLAWNDQKEGILLGCHEFGYTEKEEVTVHVTVQPSLYNHTHT